MGGRVERGITSGRRGTVQVVGGASGVQRAESGWTERADKEGEQTVGAYDPPVCRAQSTVKRA